MKIKVLLNTEIKRVDPDDNEVITDSSKKIKYQYIILNKILELRFLMLERMTIKLGTWNMELVTKRVEDAFVHWGVENMNIMGDKTRIRKLNREDVDKMQLWGKHENPAFLHYNFPNLSKNEKDLWYKIKAKDLRRRCFAIEDIEDNLIGYIALRDIKFFKRESELGIVFDPARLNKGYGTDALGNFLDLYFYNLKMRKLILKVAKFNIRAFKCYEKCGFEISKEVVDEFEEQNIGLMTMKKIVKSNKEFTIDNGKLMTKYYYMNITKEKFIFHKENEELLINL